MVVAFGLLVAGHVAAGGTTAADAITKAYGFKVEVVDRSRPDQPATDGQWRTVRGVYQLKGETIEHRMTLTGSVSGCPADTADGSPRTAPARVYEDNFTVEVEGWSSAYGAGVTKLSFEPVNYAAGLDRASGSVVATMAFNRAKDQPIETDRWGRNPALKSVKVGVKNQNGVVARTFTLKACRPLEWSSLDLGAGASGQVVRDSIKVSCASLTTVSSCKGAGDRARNLLLGAVGTRRKLGRITVTTLKNDGTAQDSLRLAAPTLARYTPPNLDVETDGVEAEETMEFVDTEPAP